MREPNVDDAMLGHSSVAPAERFLNAIRTRRRGPRWSPLELATAAILATVLIYGGTTDVAILIDDAFSNSSLGNAAALVSATEWANPFSAIALLAASVLAWHINAEWREDLAIIEESIDDESSIDLDLESTSAEALSRIARSWSLASVCLAFSTVVGLASIAAVAGFVWLQNPLSGLQVWAEIGASAGSSLAVLCAAGVGIVIAHRTRTESQAALQGSDGEPGESEEPFEHLK